jgi:hypothetical protein
MWPGTDNLIGHIEQRFKNSSIDNMTGLSVTFSSLLAKEFNILLGQLSQYSNRLQSG